MNKKSSKDDLYVITDIDLTPAQKQAKKEARKEIWKCAAIGAAVGMTIGIIAVVIDNIRNPDAPDYEETENDD
jgi:hypothetical protein